MTACVSGGPVAPGDISSVLEPTEQESQKIQLAQNASPPAASDGTTASQNSLVPASNTPSPSEQATEAIASSDVKDTALTGTPKSRPGSSDPSAKPSEPSTKLAQQPIKPAPKTSTSIAAKTKAQTKPTTSLFASLFKPQRPKANVGPKKRLTKRKSRKRRSPGSLRSDGNALPGVRTKGLFGVDEDEELDQPVRLASVSNLARRSKHGLLIQRPDVNVGCFPPKLVRLLKKVERRFGRTPIVTSGYRSPKHNRRIRGARNSTHVHCMAADIQVKGISKWQVAKYLRTLPERGGVGTYCHTRSVHVDIGNKRDWNRRCKRKRRRS